MTEIKYATVKRDYKEDEKVYFADEKLRGELDKKQKKITVGRGLRLNGNVLSLADNIGGGSNFKYFTIDGLKASGLYEGSEPFEGAECSKLTVECAYIGNPKVYVDYIDAGDFSSDNYNDRCFNFINEVSDEEVNMQKVREVLATLGDSGEDFFCILPTRIISGEFMRIMHGIQGDGFEACIFAPWCYDSYGVKQTRENVQPSRDKTEIIPVIWEQLAN
jgi:hypothetical protein